MKLKKIAALALAGVMAVSMLAGCAGNTTTTDDSASSTPTAPAAGYSAQLAEILKAKDVDTVAFADDSATTAILTTALNDVTLKGSDFVSFLGSNKILGMISTNTGSAGTVKDLYTELTKLAGLKIAKLDSTKSFNSLSTNLISGSESASSKSTLAFAFMIDGQYSEHMALVTLADKLNGTNYMDKMPTQKSGTNQVVTAKYTGSVAMQKVTKDGVPAWIALVVVNADVTVTKD